MQISACLPSVYVCPPRTGEKLGKNVMRESRRKRVDRFYHRNGASALRREREEERKREETGDEIGRREGERERGAPRSRKADDIKGRKRGRALNGEMRRQSPKRLLSIVSATRRGASVPFATERIRPLRPTFSYFSCSTRHFGQSPLYFYRYTSSRPFNNRSFCGNIRISSE